MNELTETMYQALLSRMEIDLLKKAFDCACYQLECNAGQSKEWWEVSILTELAERMNKGEENAVQEQQQSME